MKRNSLSVLVIALSLSFSISCSSKAEDMVPGGMHDDMYIPDPKISAAEAKEGYEIPPVLHAANVVPANIIKTPIYTIDDKVYSDGFLDHFTIHTQYGTFYAGGRQKLETRLNEIIAIDALKKISTGAAIVDGAKEGGKAILMAPVNAVETVGHAVVHPVDTVKTVASIPMGIVDFFGSIGEKISGSGDDAAEDSDSTAVGRVLGQGADLAQDFIGYNKQVRSINEQFNLDPHSDNVMLHDEIVRVARARTGTSFSSKFVPGIPMIHAISEANHYIHQVNRISVFEDDVIQDKKVHDELLALGIDENLINKFRHSKYLTSTMRTVITNNVLALNGIKNRSEVIQLALDLESYESAWIFVQIVKFLPQLNDQYHFKAFAEGIPMPTLITANGHAIVPITTDYIFWTKTAAKIANGIKKNADNNKNIKSVEVKITGNISDRARSETEKLGITISRL